MLALLAAIILTSTDGVTWAQRQSGTTINLRSVAYGNGQFVAVGGGEGGSILTSANGVNWIQRESRQAEGTLHVYFDFAVSIAYGNGRFVAVGNDCCGDGPSSFVTSVDGMDWIVRPSGTWNHLQGIAYGNGHFVAFGDNGTILQSGSVITLSITPSASIGLLSLSLEGPSGLNYTIQTSTDLNSWRNLTNITRAQPTSVILDAQPLKSDRQFYRAYSQ